MAEKSTAANNSNIAAQCRNAATQNWPGLTIKDGKVIAAGVISEIDGFAADAGVTGGLGGQLAIVTTDQDYYPEQEAEIDGSVRAAVERASRSRVPMWIVFSPTLGSGTVIHLKQPLRLPDNITLDGTCADVTFASPSNIGQVFVFSRRNVIVQRLAFLKTDYKSSADEGDTQSSIRLNGFFDKIAILHNDLSKCGDGCIDITTSPGKPVPELARVSVEFNRIADHDKTMLFGTFTCGDKGVPPCDADYLATHRGMPPVLYLTLDGNLFLRTAQRHPRVFGRVMAHIFNNIIAPTPTSRPDGSFSDCYGIFVADAARAFVQENLFVPLWKGWKPFRAVWTTVTAGAEKMPDDTAGFIRLDQNATTTKAIIGENRPEMVRKPTYRKSVIVLPLARMAPENAVACIAARAGKRGAITWDRQLCSID